MKKKFIIYQLVDKTVHVPSTDYYARGNASEQDNLPVLQYHTEYESLLDAEQYLMDNVEDLNSGAYIILPTYIKK